MVANLDDRVRAQVVRPGVAKDGAFGPAAALVEFDLFISGASDDRGAAERAGWRFIKEGEFAKGLR